MLRKYASLRQSKTNSTNVWLSFPKQMRTRLGWHMKSPSSRIAWMPLVCNSLRQKKIWAGYDARERTSSSSFSILWATSFPWTTASWPRLLARPISWFQTESISLSSLLFSLTSVHLANDMGLIWICFQEVRKLWQHWPLYLLWHR